MLRESILEVSLKITDDTKWFMQQIRQDHDDRIWRLQRLWFGGSDTRFNEPGRTPEEADNNPVKDMLTNFWNEPIDMIAEGLKVK